MPEKNQGQSREEILAEAKLQAIGDFSPNDIFVAGYPKSGNTWVQNLIAGLLYGIDIGLAPDAMVQDLVPDVNFKRFYRRYLASMYFKTHELPKPNYRKVIYLVRDGRDVMVSYFHHLAAIGDPPDFWHLVSTGKGLFPCRWHEHIEAWVANPHHAQMITIHYEMLKKDAVTQLQRICDFGGLERDEGFLEQIARNATFERMREKEKKFGWQNSAWPKDKPFVRRGKVGSFKDEMPRPVLEAFLKHSTGTLRRLGYLE